jgi:hypothetical protein
LFVHVMTGRARGVTKGVHYIAFLAGAHQNDNFNFEKLFPNVLILFGYTQISFLRWLEVVWVAQMLPRMIYRMIIEVYNKALY